MIFVPPAHQGPSTSLGMTEACDRVSWFFSQSRAREDERYVQETRSRVTVAPLIA